MIRIAVLLLSIMTGVEAKAESLQRLNPDTKFPSVLDLSNGTRDQRDEPSKAQGSPVYYHGTSAPQEGSMTSVSPRTQFVRGYTRANGTYVAPYVRSSRRR